MSHLRSDDNRSSIVSSLSSSSLGSSDFLFRQSSMPEYAAGSASNSIRRLVKWNIHWQKPTLIASYTLGGVMSAIGHHVYYGYMDTKIVSTVDRQQWALRFGTAFTVCAIGLLRCALIESYTQCIWKLFRYKSISIKGIDRIFSLTSDIRGFYSPEVLKEAWLPVLLAGLTWYVILPISLPWFLGRSVGPTADQNM